MDKMTLRAGLQCLLLACCLLLGGCAKRPIDGDIEGYWRLERFVTRADGQVHRCERIFYGITRYVVEVAERQGAGGYGAFVGRFEYVDGSSRVAMKDFRQRAATSDNGRPATPAELLPFPARARVLLRPPGAYPLLSLQAGNAIRRHRQAHIGCACRCRRMALGARLQGFAARHILLVFGF